MTLVKMSRVVGLVVLGAAAAEAGPRWQRLSWTGPTDTTLTVSWTDATAGVGFIEVRRPGATAVTFSATTTATNTSELNITYTAVATGLSPSTSYEYRVYSGGAYGTWTTVRTAPPASSCTPVRLVFGGDTRGEDIPFVGYTPSGQFASITQAMASENPLLAVNTGDFVRAGDQAAEWAAELPRLEPLSKGVPWFLALGNHDDGPGVGPGARFNGLFEYAAGSSGMDDYYALVVGNVLVVGMSTYSVSFDTQVTWLESVLQATNGQVDWRLISFHAPIWSSGAHGNNENDVARAATLVPLLDRYAVDVVFNGHDHDYERFHPSKGGWGGVPRVSTPLPLDQGRRGAANGTTYIVTGGSGALVNPIFTAGSGSAMGSNHLHYVVVDANAGALTLTVRDCGTQSIGPASCSGALETVRLERATTVCRGAGDGGVDAGVVDAGTGVDAGTDAGADAGRGDAGVDAGVDAGRDAGVDASVDAGTAVDAGAPDSGSAADAGGSVDAGDATDAGTDPPRPSGCGCTSGADALMLVAGLGVLLRRRSARWARPERS